MTPGSLFPPPRPRQRIAALTPIDASHRAVVMRAGPVQRGSSCSPSSRREPRPGGPVGECPVLRRDRSQRRRRGRGMPAPDHHRSSDMSDTTNHAARLVLTTTPSSAVTVTSRTCSSSTRAGCPSATPINCRARSAAQTTTRTAGGHRHRADAPDRPSRRAGQPRAATECGDDRRRVSRRASARGKAGPLPRSHPAGAWESGTGPAARARPPTPGGPDADQITTPRRHRR
jgi:hypothetical protein